MDDTPLTLASPTGMLCHVLKAQSPHPADLTCATLDRLRLPATPASITATHRVIAAIIEWMTRTGARPGIDRRDVFDVAGHLDLSGHDIATREAATDTLSQLLTLIWGDEVCTANGRRQRVAQQLGYPWDLDDGYPTSPYLRVY